MQEGLSGTSFPGQGVVGEQIVFCLWERAKTHGTQIFAVIIKWWTGGWSLPPWGKKLIEQQAQWLLLLGSKNGQGTQPMLLRTISAHRADTMSLSCL